MVDDWFGTFTVEHRARHPKEFLPDPHSEEGANVYGALRSNFIHRGISDYEIATLASELLQGETLRHSSQHFPRLIDLAVGIYRERNAGQGDPGVTDRDTAVTASKGCEHCGGTGMATLYHPTPDLSRRMIPSVGAHCSCALGRWTRSKTAPADLAGIPDYAAPGWWLYDPPGFEPVAESALRTFGPAALLRGMIQRAEDAAKRPRVVTPPAPLPDPTEADIRRAEDRREELRRQFAAMKGGAA